MDRCVVGDVRLGFEEPLSLVWKLVLGEVLTPRNEIGPLARFWVPAGTPRRASGEGPPEADGAGG